MVIVVVIIAQGRLSSYPRVLSKKLKNARHRLQCVANDKDEDDEKADPEQKK